MILLSGPCAAESREQVLLTAKQLSEGLPLISASNGLENLHYVYRAGIWKPRSQPGSFEGAGYEALSWLKEVQDTYGFPVATEVASSEHVHQCMEHGITHLWLGARTSTNPFLVNEIVNALSEYQGPLIVYVKNPISPDLNLWKGAIQRVANVIGWNNVIAVHRGFSTGQVTDFRNNPCWSIIPKLRLSFPNLPILLDASHMGGQRSLIYSLCQQAVYLQYDGWMLESHCAPESALSDAQQQLSPAELVSVLSKLNFHPNSTDLGLAPYRAEIDELDEMIWQLIAQRMQVSSRIGAYKHANGLPIIQEQRYDDLLRRRLEWAKQHGLSDQLIVSILDAIHTESCHRQQ